MKNLDTKTLNKVKQASNNFKTLGDNMISKVNQDLSFNSLDAFKINFVDSGFIIPEIDDEELSRLSILFMKIKAREFN